MKEANDSWIYTEDCQPKKDGEYLVTIRGDSWGSRAFKTMFGWFEGGHWVDDDEEIVDDIVRAWMPLPKPAKRRTK